MCVGDLCSLSGFSIDPRRLVDVVVVAAGDAALVVVLGVGYVCVCGCHHSGSNFYYSRSGS